MESRILAGRYELFERVGEGGMAVVFKAKDRVLNRLVAIKILRPEYTKDSLFIESFRRESQIVANLVHPNIVNIYDVGKQGNIYYIVMELIDGKPLSEIIKEEGVLDPRWAVAMAKEIASGLSLAHKHQLIHRDIKPHNVLVTKDGTAKIADFGIAKTVSSDTFVGEQKDAVMGSVHYFSPEQARGGYVDERSDLYSLGIVLYEMLTGKVPFDGETAVEVAVKHMNEPMVPPSRLRSDIPQDLENIILKATGKQPDNRFRNADEMITALNFVKFSRHSESTGASAESVSEHEAAKEAEKLAQEGSREQEKKNVLSRKAPVDPQEEEGGAGWEEAGKDSAGTAQPVPFYKRKAVQILAALLLALLLALPTSKLAYLYAAKNSAANAQKEPEVFELEDLKGTPYEEAKTLMEKKGLTISVEMELVSSEFEAGVIMSQSPSAGETVKRGQNIRVSVSKGQTQDVVPDFTGKTLASARLMIQNYGYELRDVVFETSETVMEDYVISQTPEKGSRMESSARIIDLVVSKGPEEQQAEGLTCNVVGMTYDEAVAAITEKGLVIRNVTRTNNVSVPADCVISQSPSGTEEVKEGDPIDLVISNGMDKPSEVDPADPTAPTEPDPDEVMVIKTVSIPVDFSLAANDSFLLTVNVSDDVDGIRTPIVKQPTEKIEGTRIITIAGSGPNGRVVIRFDNDIVYDLSVNFDTGEYQ
ncbi:MAG: Stk1 family PASTA domain-containing Ser/Thr kinase [Firmicutes bacterium]|nr:Stk1 family PASTA domain-containing Ser/Thr kinase [Bacillota bacterium]